MGIFDNIFGRQQPPVQKPRVNVYRPVGRNAAVYKPVRKIQTVVNTERGFTGAKLGRLTSDWNDIEQTINASLHSGLKVLRDRSRDLALNDSYAKKYIKSLLKNVVGPDGFILRNKAMELKSDETGELKLVYDKEANRKIQEAFVDWSLPENCDITGRSSFRELCNLLLRTLAADGEILIKPVYNNSKYGYQLQFVSGEYLDEHANGRLPGGNYVIMGVEMTPYGKPVAYYLKNLDPFMSNFHGAFYTGSHTRIPILNEYGLPQIKHLFVRETLNQVRGIPWFAPAMLRLRMLNGFEEAILVGARVAANSQTFFEQKDNFSAPGIDKANISGYQTTDEDPAALVYKSEPGSERFVPWGYQVKSIDHNIPSGKEGDFVKNTLRGIASGLDVSYISLANNYEAVNYTSSRTNMLEERDTWKELHSWMREHFLNWNYTPWLSMALLTEHLNLPASRFEKFNKPWYQARAWQWVSPKDEADAILLLLQNNAASVDEYLGERGWDIESFIDQLKYERALFEKEGIPFPGSNYSKATAVPAKQQEDQNDDKNTDDPKKKTALRIL